MFIIPIRFLEYFIMKMEHYFLNLKHAQYKNVLSLYDNYSLLKFYLNISMWDLVLKDLLQEIKWCNRNLIWIFCLGVMTFFIKSHYVHAS